MGIEKLAAIVILAGLSVPAMASEFDGPFVQLGVGGSRSYTHLNGTRNAVLDGTSSQGNVNGLVAAGYSQSLGSAGFNMAANVFYVIGNQNAGAPSNTVVGTNGSNSANTRSTFSNSFGIAVEPGWNFTEKTLGYAKLAWVYSDGVYSSNSTISTAVPPRTISDSGVINKSMNGFGYGLGIKQTIAKDIYLGVDIMGIAYNSSKTSRGVTVRPEQLIGFMSLGYRF